MIGKILVKQKKFEDAQIEILKSLRMYPNAESYYYYGLALRGSKQNEEALAAFEKAVKTFPNYIEVYHEMSRTFEDLKKFDKALQAAQKSVSLDTSNFHSRRTLSHVYFVLERLEDAEKEIVEGIRMMKSAGQSDPALYGDFGDIMLKQNKTDLALSQYEIQWSVDSTSAQTPYRMASIYAARGDDKKASVWMLKALLNKFTDFVDLDKNKMFDPVRNKPVFKELIRQYEQAYREELLKRLQKK
jgi:predicted Zn-dependent protease